MASPAFLFGGSLSRDLTSSFYPNIADLPGPNYIDTSLWFNRSDYSDVTIRFSDREVACHKFVLCTKSEYFSLLCGVKAKLKVHHLVLYW